MFQPKISYNVSDNVIQRSETCEALEGGSENEEWQGARNMMNILDWEEGSNVVGLPKGKKVLVYVHGFTMRYPMAVENIKKLEKAFSCTIVGFVWPGTFKGFTKTGKVVTYIHSRSLAEQSAGRFRKLLEVLLGHDNEVNIIGHSMGCRVVLQALLDWDEKRIRNVFLWAAAIPACSFDASDQFPIKRLAEADITVFCSENDDVLPSGYKVGEFLPAMMQARRSTRQHMTALGLRGPCPGMDPHPEDANEVEQRVRTVDVSEEVRCHHTGSWLASGLLQSTMCKLLELPEVNLASQGRILTAKDLEEHESLVSDLKAIHEEDDAALLKLSTEIEEEHFVNDAH